jgi:hypothetical protein
MRKPKGHDHATVAGMTAVAGVRKIPRGFRMDEIKAMVDRGWKKRLEKMQSRSTVRWIPKTEGGAS